MNRQPGGLPDSAAAPGRVRRTRRPWLWLLVPLAFLLVVVRFVVPPARRAADVITGANVKRELDRIKSRGEPVTIKDIIPPPVPDSQNAAVPYQQAFELLPNDEDDDRIRSFLSRDPAERAKVSRQRIEGILAEHVPAFRLLEQGSRMPRCRFPVQWTKGYQATFPHMAGVRRSVRMLAARAIFSAEHGDTHSALDDIQTSLRIADHISGEPSITAQLVRWACQAIALDSLNRCMQTSPLSPADCERVNELLGRIDNMRPFITALQGERCMAIWFYDGVRKDPSVLANMASDVSGEESKLSERKPSSLAGHGPIAVLLTMGESYLLRFWEREIALAHKPFREAKPALEALSKEPEKWPRYAVVSAILAPVHLSTVANRDRAIAKIGLAQWGLALRVYQAKTGRYPDSLAQVRRLVGWKLPQDIFSGKDFIYRREGRGYLLYSIGINLRDDGGEDNDSWQRQWKVGKPWLPKEKRPDDIIWPMPV